MSICTDCTVDYQKKMMEQARCQSPDANVKFLQEKEMEETMRQEVIAEKLGKMDDYWMQMVSQLSPVPAKQGKK